MYQRNWLTPVSLTVECPVLHLELYACFANAHLLDFLNHAGDGILLICKSIQEL